MEKDIKLWMETALLNSITIGEISIKLPNLTERSIIESLLQIGQLYYDNIYNVVKPPNWVK